MIIRKKDLTECSVKKKSNHKINTHTFFILLLLLILLFSCADKEYKCPPITSNSQSNNTKFIVNFYQENSGSINGYVTEGSSSGFTPVIQSLLSGAVNNPHVDKLNLYYINSETDRRYQNANVNDISSFVSKELNPTVFNASIGGKDTTDIAFVISSVLNNTNKNTVTILCSDFIFSPGRNNDAMDYIKQQRININGLFSKKLREMPTLSVVALQFYSLFTGTYYDHNNTHIPLDHIRRPFYIWIMGNQENVNNFLYGGSSSLQAQIDQLSGTHVENDFYISNVAVVPQYELMPPQNPQDFKICNSSNPPTVYDIDDNQIGNSKKANEIHSPLTIHANYSHSFISQSQLKGLPNAMSISDNGTYTMQCIPTTNKEFDIMLSTQWNIPKGESTVALLYTSSFPQWASKCSSTNDENVGNCHVSQRC